MIYIQQNCITTNGVQYTFSAYSCLSNAKLLSDPKEKKTTLCSCKSQLYMRFQIYSDRFWTKMQKPLCVSIIAKSLSELNKNKIDHSQEKIVALLWP